MDSPKVKEAITAYALKKHRDYNRKQYRKRLDEGYYEKNKVHIKNIKKKHYENNKAAYIFRARKWNDEHQELRKKYYEAHREKRIAATVAWQKSHAEQYREYQKQYRERKKLERSSQLEQSGVSQSTVREFKRLQV